MGITADQIEEFLDKLNDDADFRDSLKSDPIAVLQAYGIDTSEVEVPSEVQLPSEGEVNANRDAFRDALFPADSGFLYQPFFKLPPTGD